jgi:hypothetical protein
MKASSLPPNQAEEEEDAVMMLSMYRFVSTMTK